MLLRYLPSVKLMTSLFAFIICRSHVQRWLLPVPDVRRKRSRFLGPARAVPGYGPAAGPLLHQLLPQHLPDRKAVWRKVLGGDVSPGAAVRMQVKEG